jgi:hypothetical protein
MIEKIGRNAPCPCGSGRKYKHCCAGKATEPEGPTSAPGLVWVPTPSEPDEREYFLRFAEEAIDAINQAPLDDFASLSPSQVQALNFEPFDTPELLRIVDPCPVPPHGAVIELAIWLLEAIGEGVPTTERGNLPRKLCRALLERVQAQPWTRDLEQHVRVGSETDFALLHRVRIALELSGLLRKYRKRFVPTKRCRERLAASGARGIYPVLLRGYATKFDWAFADLYPESPMLQQTSWFVLWLLHRFGEHWRSSSFYEDAVLRAFPILLEDFADEERFEWLRPEDSFRAAVRLRILRRFAEAFGLIETRERDPARVREPFEVRRTELFEQAIVFPAAP